MGKDFNPRFVFDAGPDLAAQSPWDFKGAAQEALRDPSGGTTIDEKIERALRRKLGHQSHAVPPKGSLQKPAVPLDRRRGPGQSSADSDQAASSEDDTDDDYRDEGSDSDKPLPGELSDGSDEELESADEEEEEEESSDEEEETDGSPAPARCAALSERKGRVNVPSESQRTARKDPPHGRMHDEDGDDDDGEEEDEEEEEEEEEDGMGRGRKVAEASDDVSSDDGSDASEEAEDEDGSADESVEEETDDRRVSGKAAGPSGRDQSVADASPSGGKNGSFFVAAPKGTSFSAGRFEDLQLSRPLLKACAALGYAHPTPIQAAVIPLALMGRDICGSAMTGSGKTAAFTLPLLERLLYRSRAHAATYALILTPTRELAVQVHSMVGRLAQYTDIRAALVVGGLSLQAQATALRARPEIVVATPGRIIDHLRNTHSVGLEELQALVLDEADRLLHLGFSEDIKQIVKLTPRKRQTLLFSATMTEEVRQLAAVSLCKPVRLAADPAAAAPRSLLQEVIRLKGSGAGAKEALLLAVCARSFRGGRTIVFFRTKQAAHRAKMLFGLAALPPAAELHGNLTQAARLDALEKFRLGEAAFLLATDVAARGLDILGVEVVINFDAPDSVSSYLHRIGRTARAGAGGRAVTFVEDSDRALLKEVVKKMKVDLKARVVPQEVVQKWAARLEQLEPDVQRLVKEEKEETVLRKAEMEMRKAENLMEHEAEIQARPPRTWHQTPKQKKALAELERSAMAGGSAFGGEEEEEEGPGARGKAGKKAKKEREREERKRKRAEEAAEAKRAARNSLMQETEAVAKKIRAAKSTEAKLRQEGMAPGRAGRAAVASLSSLSASQKKRRKQKAKRQGALAEPDPDGGGNAAALFEGDGTGRKLLPGSEGGQRRSKVYPGGGRSGKVVAPSAGKSKRELNLLKRKGKGVKQFKSKARHKRRR